MSKKYVLILVPETHWDREWYSPFQEFRIRLAKLTDKLLGILDTDPEYKSFTFDGQTVVIEDYLEIRPQNRQKIEDYVREGRILIGPWYILPDEFLVSAEATVRNLMIGHKIGEEFGRVMKAGYIPDPFGHLSQLPQILTGFGIPSVFFMRGMGEEADEMHSEFWWEAADGTKILAHNQCATYCNAMHLGYDRTPEGFKVNFDKALEQVKGQIDVLGKKASTKYLLLNNGCDHVEPQPELAEIIKYVNEHLDDGEIIHSTYEDYAERVLREKPELKTYRGELHKGKFQPLLPGVFSARMYIKQANEQSQTLLEKWAEPASAFAWMHGGVYDHQFIWEAWKLLIKNHPHDSICGCSIDQVHNEMMTRFDQSQQIAGVMTNESHAFLAGKVDTSRKDAPEGSQAIVVFNPHAWDATDAVKVRVEKDLGPGEAPPRYVVRDAKGAAVAGYIANDHVLVRDRRRARWSADVCFSGKNVPSLGYATYYLDSGEAKVASALEVGLGVMENEFVKVTVRGNGTFDLLHKPSRATYENLNVLEDTEDVGDEYNYGSAYNSRTVTSEGVGGTLSIAESGSALATMRADFVLDLPESATIDRMARSEQTVPCKVVVYVTVHADLPRVDVVTVFDNQVKDHRLRAQFPTGHFSDYCFAEGQFDVVKRAIEIPAGEGWSEKPVGQKPVQSFVAVDDADCGIAVINQGMPEYEVLRSEQCTIAQTLLRCVGWLSRDDYQERPYNAGPTIATPEAQCQGKHVFKYAALPYQGKWTRALVWRQAHQHNAPLRPVLTSIHKGSLPKSQSFVCVEPANLVVTAVKKAEKSNALVVRVLNTTPATVSKAVVKLSSKFKSATLANLNEEPIDAKLEVAGNSVTFPMPAFRVQTVLFEL